MKKIGPRGNVQKINKKKEEEGKISGLSGFLEKRRMVVPDGSIHGSLFLHRESSCS